MNSSTSVPSVCSLIKEKAELVQIIMSMPDGDAKCFIQTRIDQIDQIMSKMGEYMLIIKTNTSGIMSMVFSSLEDAKKAAYEHVATYAKKAYVEKGCYLSELEPIGVKEHVEEDGFKWAKVDDNNNWEMSINQHASVFEVEMFQEQHSELWEYSDDYHIKCVIICV
jgi:hypothetical protein